MKRRMNLSFWLAGPALVLAAIAFPMSNASAAQTARFSCGSAAGTPGVSAPASSPIAATPAPTQAVVAVEQNPPGDIPDNQAFVNYSSTAGGYSISMPEGWARTENGADVTFTDKLHVFSVELTCAAMAPTVQSATADDVPQLAASIQAFSLADVTPVDLPSGAAIRIDYQANSQPDEVTGKQHRLDVQRFELFKDGKLATVTLATPAGSDNVDVSNQVLTSFTWLP